MTQAKQKCILEKIYGQQITDDDLRREIDNLRRHEEDKTLTDMDEKLMAALGLD